MTTDKSTKKIEVGLVQINNTYSGENYLPLSVGMLQAYAQKHLQQPENYTFGLPIYRRVAVEDAVQHLLGSDVVFFSAYVWNYRISLQIAQTLKEKAPETIIVFGGPQVPDRVEQFVRDHPFIDLACHAEGEQTATRILENLVSKDWKDLPGVSFIQNDELVSNPTGPRLVNMDNAPSPYLEGVFIPLMEANPNEHWIGLWETNRGCPFSCAFCDWGSATQAKVLSFELERLYAEAEWFAQHKIEFIFCCDANFGILPRDIDLATHVAKIKEQYGYPMALSVQNTKNATERAYKVQQILADAGLNKGVGISLQSADPFTLESIKRSNISSDSYQELQQRFTKDGVETYTELILGLPGESYDSFTNGVSSIIDNGQHNRVKVNDLSILPNAAMGDPEYQKKFGMITVETKVINFHGSLDESDDEIYETQDLVIGTSSLPKEDWVRARSFSWFMDLLYFDKILQLPLMLVREQSSITYRELIEEFLVSDLEPFPTLSEIRNLFMSKAADMQNGAPELFPEKDWLNIWWPVDEHTMIRLCRGDKLDDFYDETEGLLNRLLEKKSVTLPEGLLHEAITLNRALIKLPFQTEDAHVDLSYNIWEYYRSTLVGGDVQLEESVSRYQINRTSETWSSWDDWSREIIWYGHKKGAYLYGTDSVDRLLAGHY